MAVQVRNITGTRGSFAEDLGGGIANVLDAAYKKKKYEAAEKQRNERLKVQDHLIDIRTRAGELDLKQSEDAYRKATESEAGSKAIRALNQEHLAKALAGEMTPYLAATPERTRGVSPSNGMIETPDIGAALENPLEQAGSPEITAPELTITDAAQEEVASIPYAQKLGLVGEGGQADDTPIGKAYADLVYARGEEERKINLAREVAESGPEYETLTREGHASLSKAAQGLYKVGGRYKRSELADQLAKPVKSGGETSSGYGKPWYNKETQSYQQTHKVTGESRDAPGTGSSTSDDGGNVLSKNFGQTEGGIELVGPALMDRIRETDYSTAAKMEGLISGAFDPRALETMRGGRRSALFSLIYRVTKDEKFRTYNQADYQTRFKTRNEFLTGKAAANVRSLNTAMGHAEDAIILGEKMNNKSWQTWNRLKNAYKTEFGDTEVTNFDKAIDALVAESATLFKGTAGTDQEIKEWRKNFNNAQSPEQIQEGIETLMHLFRSRMDALSNQYAQGMGREMQSDELLSEKNRAFFNKYASPEDQIPDPTGDSLFPYQQDFEQLARDEEREVVEGMQVQMDGQNRGIVNPNMMSEGLGGPQSEAPEVQWERGPDGRPRPVTPEV